MADSLIRDYPSKEYCNATIINWPWPGHHIPYGRGVRKGQDPYYFTMLRDPFERLKSAYSYGRHGSKLKSSNISFDTFVNESHIPNSCQLKMMLGFQCFEDVDPRNLNVTLALERVKSPRFFFGITEQWNKSICLFHKWFGGTMQPFELKNNRKTKRVDESGFIDHTSAETLFFNEAIKVFDDRIKEAGC